VPSAVESIPEKCFEGCSRLSSVTYEEGSQIRSIGASAFDHCPELTAFCVPPSVTIIPLIRTAHISLLHLMVHTRNTHFQVADQLLLDFAGRVVISCFGYATEVIIPATVESLKKYAFWGLKSMQTLFFSTGSQVRAIGDWAFRDWVDLLSICSPKSAEICRPTASRCVHIFRCLSSKAIRGCPGSTTMRSINACPCYRSVFRPVTTIRITAFCGCARLKSLTFEPNSLLLLFGDWAFRFCSELTAILIPNSVSNLGGYCFLDCACLVAVEFGAGSRLVSIRHLRFEG
jgi:hypothetical protein